MTDNLLAGDGAAAFVLPFCAFVARTPQEVPVVKVNAHVIPAAVTDMGVEDTVWGTELTARQGEAAYHHHRNTAGPGQPAQSAG